MPSTPTKPLALFQPSLPFQLPAVQTVDNISIPHG